VVGGAVTGAAASVVGGAVAGGAVVAGGVVAGGAVLAGAAVVGVVSTGSVSVGASVVTVRGLVVLVDDVDGDVGNVAVVAVAPAGAELVPDRASRAITSAAVTTATAMSVAPSARSSALRRGPGGAGSYVSTRGVGAVGSSQLVTGRRLPSDAAS
jgi:hypothetical protein